LAGQPDENCLKWYGLIGQNNLEVAKTPPFGDF
jgi:hypothetical protein